MPNINFVPDDYIQSNESRRTNLFCVVMLLIVMIGLMGAFGIIKMRQKACAGQESLVNAKSAHMQEAIKQFEQLQSRRKEMMKTALMTAELLEPVPRSIVLASLTNELPAGTSLKEVKFNQKEPASSKSQTTSAYQAKKAGSGGKGDSQNAKDKDASEGSKVSVELAMETLIDIGGIAPSDLQVAAYIERLSSSPLFEGVALVESKEFKTSENTLLREFKLKAQLRKNVRLSAEDVKAIRSKAEKSIYNF
jgi:Tfp pilus assembly protein PilN